MADVQIELGLDDKEYQRSIDGVRDNTDKAARDSGRSLERNVGDRGAAAFRRLALAAAAAGAAIGTALFTRASIKAATEQEAVTRRLEFALAAAGEEVESNSRRIQEFAAEIQRTTTLSNEAVEGQAALALSLGATADQVTGLVGASANLAAALGTSLDGATQRLARTLQGDLSARLAQVIPELRDFTEEQLRSGAAIDFVAARFAGAAQSEVRTFQGAITQLSETFADLQKAFGQIVTESEPVRAFISIIRDAVEQLESFVISSQEKIRQFGENTARTFLTLGREIEVFIRSGIDPLKDSFFTLGIAVEALNNLFGAEFRGIINTFNIFVDSLITGVNVITEGLLRIVQVIQRLDIANVTGLDAIADQLDGRLRESIERTNASAERTNQSIQNLLDPNQYEDVGSVVEVFRELFEGIDEASRNDEGELIFDRLLAAFDEENLTPKTEAFSEASDQWSSDLLKVADDSEKAATKAETSFLTVLNSISDNVRNSFAAGVSQAFAQVGAALAQGENAFKSFGAALIGTLGQVSQQIGQAFILQGAGYLLLNPAFGAGLIAAGAALSTFGGFLSSKSSSGPGVAGGASATSRARDAFEAPAPDNNIQREEAQRQVGQNVQLVVQGDILDSEDTGRRLVDLLNSNFESDNSALVGARFA